MANVMMHKEQLSVSAKPWEYPSIKLIPGAEWRDDMRCWVIPHTKPSVEALEREVIFESITDGARKKISDIKSKKETKNKFPADYEFKRKPYPHQLRALNISWGLPYFGFFMWMGLGKTFVDINHTCCLMKQNKIKRNLIICPTPIKPVWVSEISKYSTVNHSVFTLEAGKASANRAKSWMATANQYAFLIVGIEALSQGGAHGIAEVFVRMGDAKITVDESTKIKSPGKNRTKKCTSLGIKSKYRTILNGTPITQGMEDLYAQFKFLDWEILGYATYAEFKAAHVISIELEKHEKVVGYRNVPALMQKISPWCFLLKTEDVFDLPPKIYEQRFVKPSLSQLKVMKQLSDDMEAEDAGDVLEVKSTLERMTRYQQITGGFFPHEDNAALKTIRPISGENPKLEDMMEVIEELPANKKAIIWARFRPEIALIVDRLHKKHGHAAVAQFHGGMTGSERTVENDRFQNDATCRFMVSNQQIGARGQTWTAASYELFFSNTFSYDDREQAESRAWGRVSDINNSVVYIDFILDHKNDRMITDAIARKMDVAALVAEQLKDRGQCCLSD